jgi:rubrerythrin
MKGLTMSDELTEVLETALYKEIAAEAFYSAGQNNTTDPGARSLMKELAEEERRHVQVLKSLKEKDWKKGQWHSEKMPNLMISEYLTGSDKLEGASLQDTLVTAMKREQQAVEFYSRMMSSLRDEEAKRLCERLVHDELKHKYRLEVLYDDLFYQED